MPLNSVNTNNVAMLSLQAMNKTNSELAGVQKRISTGYRVSDGQDDGAAYAVAESVRGEIAATRSSNEQLGGVKGLLDVTSAGLSNVNESLKKLKEITIKMIDGNVSTDQKAQYKTQVGELIKNVKSFIADATYNGTNILNAPANATVSVVRNGQGESYTFATYDAAANIYSLISTATGWTGAAGTGAISTTGSLTTAMSNTLTQLNNFGSYAKYVDSQITYNSQKMDAQESGLGALVDADLAKESAKLQALQIRQQLGSQALGIANQAPQSLLSLFR